MRRLPWEIRFLIKAPIYIGLPVGLVLAAAFVTFTAAIPDPMALRRAERSPSIRIMARDGTLIAERGGANDYVPIDLLPRNLLNAVVATEDRRFFSHYGVDPWGLLRAVFANLNAGRVAQGGSTLTQQLAKNLFLTSDRTMRRKLEEVVMALWLEVRLSKREILELYLNRVYFGAGAYGVETAARRFFDKSAQELTLGEAAVLAGMLKAPSKYSPANNPAIAWARAREVLGKMADAGFLTPIERDETTRAAVRFSGALRDDTGYEYALDAVIDRVSQLVGPFAGDTTVETTLDRNLQKRAQAIVRDTLQSDGRKAEAGQASLVVLDLDGGIRTLVGGRAYAESQFNRALKAQRQPGSAFKPFVYLAALEGGMTPDSIVQDVPLTIAGWTPRNDNGVYRGAVTLRDALAHSMNAAAARLAIAVGPRRAAAVARRLGIRSELREEASLALGTSEVNLVELTSAYDVIANGGFATEPYLVTRVRGPSGDVLYQRPVKRLKAIVAPEHIAAMNNMLGAVLVSGTGRRAQLAGVPAAGKTGTSQDFRDAWFVGYTAHFTAGVWVGNDDGKPMQRITGGSLPARLWHDVMAFAHEGLPAQGLSEGMLANTGVAPADKAALEARSPRQPRDRIDANFISRAVRGAKERQSAAGSASSDSAGTHEPARRGWAESMIDGFNGLKNRLGYGT